MGPSSTLKTLFKDNNSFVPSGNLIDVPLPRILFFLKLQSESGVLSIKRGEAQKHISFEKGNPRFVMSNILKECLGRIFVAKGRITQEQCEESLELMKKYKKRQGEVLVKMGLLKSYEIDEALKEQSRERMISIFKWQDGEYVFTSKLSLKKELVPIDIDIPQIILLGINRYYNINFLKPRLEAVMDLAPVFVESELFPLESFKFSSWETKAIKVFKGRASLRQIIGAEIAGEIDLYHLVYSMGSLDVVKFTDPEAGEFKFEQSSIGRNVIEVSTPFKAIKTKPGTAEVSKEYVYGEKTKERIIKKRKKQLKILQYVLLALILVVFFKWACKPGINIDEFADPQIIESATISDNVVVLKCNPEWNKEKDSEITKGTLNAMMPKIVEQGFKKVRMVDYMGNVIAVAFVDEAGNFLIAPY
jgi:hypothetical protein